MQLAAKRKFIAQLWFAAWIVALFGTSLAAQEPAFEDSSPHQVRSINVDQNVDLQVLDWGGSGRTLILLAGLGDTAHIFDQFAPKLAGAYHVYGSRGADLARPANPRPSTETIRRTGSGMMFWP